MAGVLLWRTNPWPEPDAPFSAWDVFPFVQYVVLLALLDVIAALVCSAAASLARGPLALSYLGAVACLVAAAAPAGCVYWTSVECPSMVPNESVLRPFPPGFVVVSSESVRARGSQWYWYVTLSPSSAATDQTDPERVIEHYRLAGWRATGTPQSSNRLVSPPYDLLIYGTTADPPGLVLQASRVNPDYCD